MNDADVKADKDAIKAAGALATQKDLEAVNTEAETAKRLQRQQRRKLLTHIQRLLEHT